MSRPERRPALTKPQRLHPAAGKPAAESGAPAAGAQLVTLSVRVPAEHLRRLKVASATSGQPMQELVDEAVGELLDRRGL